eukprot:14463986-Alexandrium_andersonii.AAC.1
MTSKHSEAHASGWTTCGTEPPAARGGGPSLCVETRPSESGASPAAARVSRTALAPSSLRSVAESSSEGNAAPDGRPAGDAGVGGGWEANSTTTAVPARLGVCDATGGVGR